ncbi:hypothetical protein HF888_11430 [Bermanella marisrubri]|uniref:Lipoprotein n=1 Tax=Bermanella marisrubri TaxID=207949 RepID=Q1N162_9GAMM|nr:hypothetical protein [Bermanella marisrubri]EAT11989.1 hypothetical protein RED65_11630 [Oceanobacter sp. RED65] [Bermanella marisrubri]QIZ84793.1 hypothetical protein HF888_11430 [Bermanella marisrubri]
MAFRKWLFIVLVFTVTACSSLDPKYGQVRYDYAIASEYELSPQHRFVAMMLEYPNGNQQWWPKQKLESLALKWTQSPKQADVVLYVRLSSPHLVERPAGWRKTVTYNDAGVGEVNRESVQRGYIRTHYVVELVDKRLDTLIQSYRLAHNFAIEAPFDSDKQQRTQLLRQAFNTNKPEALKDFMNNLNAHLESRYLKPVCYTFAHKDYRLVQTLEQEASFSQAFEVLKGNSKAAAKQALDIYNRAIKPYQEQEGEDAKRIRVWLDDGIGAATDIMDTPHKDRY